MSIPKKQANPLPLKVIPGRVMEEDPTRRPGQEVRPKGSKKASRKRGGK